MKKNPINEVENLSLSAKQIKAKLENSLAYDHSKYKNTEILFSKKLSEYTKLPFSDFKVSISEELENQELLLENLYAYANEFKQIEEDIPTEEILVEIPEEDNINVIEEVYEFDEIDDEFEDDEDEEYELDEEDEEDDELAERPFDDNAKKPRVSYTFIKVVDIGPIIEKIKREAIEKNKGKPVISRRHVNKLLKPYLIKKSLDMDIDGLDESLTSIDIYLNAVNKIANNNDSPLHDNHDNSLELNLNDILNDLDNK